MSISVGFTTESKRENSTKHRTMPTVHDCTFKNGCSMLSPTLFLEINSNDFPAYTGFKIGSKYYNVTDIRSVRNNLFEVSGRIDVLATYKTAIGNSNEYVIRAAASYNPYVIDTKYPALASSHLENVLLSNLRFTSVSGNGTFVLGVVAPTTSGSAVTYYSMGLSNFTSVMLKLFDPTYLAGTELSVELQKELVNPMQYIVSCYWYPFDIIGDDESLKFGWWDTQVSCGRLSESHRIQSTEQTFSMPQHPQAATRGMFLKDSPYTRYTLNCYSFGSIPIDPAPFVRAGSGAIQIDVDVFTGIGQLYLASQGSRLFQATAQIGVPIQLNQVMPNIVNSGITAISSGLALNYGNIVGFASGIASAIQSLYPQVQTNGANGTKIAYLHTPNIVCEFRNIVDEDNETMGRPLCAKRTINTLSGYIQCENVDISLAASSTEREEVIRFMESGFFYE